MPGKTIQLIPAAIAMQQKTTPNRYSCFQMTMEGVQCLQKHEKSQIGCTLGTDKALLYVLSECCKNRSKSQCNLNVAQLHMLTLNSCFQLLKRLCRVCSSVSGSIPAAAVSCSFTSRINARSSSNRPLLRSNSSCTSHHAGCLLLQALKTGEVKWRNCCAVWILLCAVALL